MKGQTSRRTKPDPPNPPPTASVRGEIAELVLARQLGTMIGKYLASKYVAASSAEQETPQATRGDVPTPRTVSRARRPVGRIVGDAHSQ
jgi:hypothetical protein